MVKACLRRQFRDLKETEHHCNWATEGRDVMWRGAWGVCVCANDGA